MNHKHTLGYLKKRRLYCGLRTFLFFAVSVSLFIAGYVATKEKMNLLTVVSILGCLPASKSCVEWIMVMRYKGCPEDCVKATEGLCKAFIVMYDCVFTSYKHNFSVAHIVIQGNTVCGYTTDKSFLEQEFKTHIAERLEADGITNVSFKVYTRLEDYCSRLKQLEALEFDSARAFSVMETLNSISL